MARLNIHLFSIIVAGVSLLQHLPLTKQAKLSTGYPKTSLNFMEATAQNQYTSEEHTVVTEDGYVLTIFRITKGKNCHHPKKQRPVLLMHGLLQNSDSFLDAGPSAGLAYLLSDACYDVWVGNERGNNYARRHITLNPDKDADFWQFSVDEIGLYDVPALIDYILQLTRADRLNYIGFSQGCSTYFLMCSERPDYCKKTVMMIALAPAVTFDHTESKLFKLLCNYALYFEESLEVLGMHEFLSLGSFKQKAMEHLCQFTGWTFTEMVCGSAVLLDNYTPGAITSDTLRRFFSHFPAGTSLMNLVRYGQAINSGKFQKFDYGEKVNLEKYNSTQPPEYNLNAVSTPVVILQGKKDLLISIEDTKVLSRRLPNVLEFVEVPDPKWSHLDMIYNREIKKLVYPKIIEYLEKYSDSTP
ncbi:lipase 3-like [Epargyreus clarus]|uniref:lipase 3-like n=1 Tax=Epargyreus clarus TaxID=520877 RepID=UPI003C2ABEB2